VLSETIRVYTRGNTGSRKILYPQLAKSNLFHGRICSFPMRLIEPYGSFSTVYSIITFTCENSMEVPDADVCGTAKKDCLLTPAMPYTTVNDEAAYFFCAPAPQGCIYSPGLDILVVDRCRLSRKFEYSSLHDLSDTIWYYLVVMISANERRRSIPRYANSTAFCVVLFQIVIVCYPSYPTSP
jgi:hypothetical protein